MSISDFEIVSKLGDGAFSSVFKVVRKSDSDFYALKKVKLGALKPKEKENALNEVRILASVNHPNIIGYKEAFIDEPTNTLCIVMELAESGDLLKKISTHKSSRTSFPENEVWTTLVHVVQGLKVLHDSKILHRDLKCANIFISKDSTMKLGDLNVSKVNKRGLAYTQTGTPYYASPEVWKDQPYNSSSDIWSLGCVIYEMAALAPPFTASDMQGLYKKIIRGLYPSIPGQYSAELSNVIRTLLQVNPTLRPTCEKILEMPPVQRHIQIQYAPNPQGADLLGTIKFEPGFKNMKQKLPGPMYDLRNRGLSAQSSRPPIVEEPPAVRMVSARGRERDLPGQAEASRPAARPKQRYEPPTSNYPVKADQDYRPQIRDPRYNLRVEEILSKKESDPALHRPAANINSILNLNPHEELFKIPEAKIDSSPYQAPYKAERYAQLYSELNSNSKSNSNSNAKPAPNPVPKVPSREDLYQPNSQSREELGQAKPSSNLYQHKPPSSENLYQAKPQSRESLFQAKPQSRENLYQAKPQSREAVPLAKPPGREVPQYYNNPSRPGNYIGPKPPSREVPEYQQYGIKPSSRENLQNYKQYLNNPPSRENKVAVLASPQQPRDAPSSRENKVGQYYPASRNAPPSRDARPYSGGVDANNKLRGYAAIVLQSPKQLAPKGLSNPLAIAPPARMPYGQGKILQRVNPVWWG